MNINNQLNVSRVGEKDKLEIGKTAKWVWINFNHSQLLKSPLANTKTQLQIMNCELLIWTLHNKRDFNVSFFLKIVSLYFSDFLLRRVVNTPEFVFVKKFFLVTIWAKQAKQYRPLKWPYLFIRFFLINVDGFEWLLL